MADKRTVAVVTGGAGGMGVASARRLAAAGHAVLITDVDQGRVDATVDELKAGGATAAGLVLDVTDAAAVAAVPDAVASLGRFHLLVHTAGLSPTMASGERIMDVNLVGTARILEAVDPLVAEGCVAVCIASQAGHFRGPSDPPEIDAILADPLAPDLFDRLKPYAGQVLADPGSAYSASKWAVIRLVVAKAPSWGARGARIVSLSPGIIDTPMGRQELEQQPLMQLIIEQTPLRRQGTADEIAAVVAFLCSPEASFVTGSDVLVDGGSTNQIREMIAGMVAGEGGAGEAGGGETS